MDIEQLGDACGGLAWISERLFEIEGRLATGSGDGEQLDAHTRALLARSSRRHGQHAQWWRAALPDSPALAGPDRVRPPTGAWDRKPLYLFHQSVTGPSPNMIPGRKGQHTIYSVAQQKMLKEDFKLTGTANDNVSGSSMRNSPIRM